MFDKVPITIEGESAWGMTKMRFVVVDGLTGEEFGLFEPAGAVQLQAAASRVRASGAI